MPKQMKGLTPKQRKAAELYVNGATKVDAYKQAGYAVKTMKDTTVYRTAFRLFETKVVADYVEQLQEEARKNSVLTREEALMILTRQARAELGEFLNFDGSLNIQKIIDEGGPVIKSFKKTKGSAEITMNDQKSAIDSLAKLENWNKEKEIKFDSVTLLFDTGVDDDE